jgi:hypothetical protein
MTTKLPDVSSRYGAPMGRGWPHMAHHAKTVAAMYAAHPPTDETERRHYTVALAHLAPHPVAAPKVSLRRIRLDNGGYDSGGAYWGHGATLWYAASDDGAVDLWFRASTRETARTSVLAQFPSARFYR